MVHPLGMVTAIGFRLVTVGSRPGGSPAAEVPNANINWMEMGQGVWAGIEPYLTFRWPTDDLAVATNR